MPSLPSSRRRRPLRRASKPLMPISTHNLALRQRPRFRFHEEGFVLRFQEVSLTMPVTIEIPTAFRRFTDGAPKVDCIAATVAEALDTLTKRFPDLSRHVRDESGQIRQFLNIYLNEEDIRFLGGESCSLREGDRVLLVPSIAGGSPALLRA